MACNDADIFRHLGVEPTQQKLLLVKSRGHFRASFEPLAHAIIEVDAPGAANPNLKRYPYHRIHTWPLDLD
jgi:microcystin degradation protein MlrC